MTLSEIKEMDEIMGHYDALTMATEKQCEILVKSGFWNEDDYSRQQDAHEEMRVMVVELRNEIIF